MGFGIFYGLLTADILMFVVIFLWGFMLEMVLFGISFFAFLFRKKFLALSVFLVFISVILGAATGMIAARLSDDHYEATIGEEDIRRGNEIATAVRSYDRDTGNFPEKLDDLVPKYINEIPKTVRGDSIGYWRSKSYPGCTRITAPDGTVLKDECDSGKWRFNMRYPSKRFHMCYEFGYDNTDDGSSEEPWGMCDIL